MLRVPIRLCSPKFDYFQTYQTAKNEPRRPRCSNLYDVFSNIRDDEGQHVETMAACQVHSTAPMNDPACFAAKLPRCLSSATEAANVRNC